MEINEYNRLPISLWALEDRPREKLMRKGIQSLSDAEILALLIGSGTRNVSAVDLARHMLNQAGNNLEKLSRFTIAEMKKIKGIGQARAITIVAALELGKRRLSGNYPENHKISGSAEVYAMMYPLLADLSYEEFWILLLNRSNKIIEKRKSSQGGIAGTVTDIRMILKMAIENLASSLILCHNHPSGNLQPSEADISITRKLKESAILMDINLLDHLILTAKGYYSFADENIL